MDLPESSSSWSRRDLRPDEKRPSAKKLVSNRPAVAEGRVTPVTAHASRTSTSYCWYVLVVLTVAYTISFIDRQILALMIGPIRKDLSPRTAPISGAFAL